MKAHNLIAFSISLLVAVSGFQSCSKKSDDKPAANTVSATVNGNALSFSQTTVSTDTVETAYIATIVAASANGSATVALHIAYNLIGTTATIDVTKKDFAFIKYLIPQVEYRAYLLTPGSSGTITITRNDMASRRLEGTYKCTVVRISGSSGEATQFIEGSFAVTY